MTSEFRLCPACRAPNTVQNAVCAACGAALPKVARAPVPTFDEIPGRSEARHAARTGVQRGLLVGAASAAILGLLVVRTFRSSALQDASAQTANSAPAPTPPPAAVEPTQPVGMAPGAAVPVAPAGWERPNPYASGQPNPYASAQPNPMGMPEPVMSPATVPAVIIAAPVAGSRRAPLAEAMPVRNDSRPAAYTDADLERLHNEAAAGTDSRPTPSPSTVPARAPAATATDPRDDARLRERREAVRAAQQRVDETQSTVDDIRREARENDDDGLQEELNHALSDLKSAQRDLAKARRKLQELEGRSVLPPQ